MIVIVCSIQDPAGMNISKKLREKVDFTEAEPKEREKERWIGKIVKDDVLLVHRQEDILYCNDLEKVYTPELIIFASRHSSTTEEPTLTVHVPGNFGEAEYGGLPRTLSIAPSHYLKAALLNLFEIKNELGLEYEVSQEQTHHGPTPQCPSFFIEIGSSKKQWKDEAAGSAIAQTIINVLKMVNKDWGIAAGFGGGHYAPKFSKINLDTDMSVGHIASKYVAPLLDEHMLSQIVNKTLGKLKFFILDWKGLKSEKRLQIVEFAENNDVETLKTKDIITT
ncbi:MAG: D-aminoacyl-tRNA deacylase [Candidatus Jordarchaeum sp.]|uniref:D-aminoacyl-tRNA deacylase n=1 Tax=Candidatus Jordarchaeum sp. TaxID=2823881 RepID=UPI00404B240A